MLIKHQEVQSICITVHVEARSRNYTSKSLGKGARAKRQERGGETVPL